MIKIFHHLLYAMCTLVRIFHAKHFENKSIIDKNRILYFSIKFCYRMRFSRKVFVTFFLFSYFFLVYCKVYIKHIYIFGKFGQTRSRTKFRTRELPPWCLCIPSSIVEETLESDLGTRKQVYCGNTC